jgi:hypothetical protein
MATVITTYIRKYYDTRPKVPEQRQMITKKTSEQPTSNNNNNAYCILHRWISMVYFRSPMAMKLRVP